MATVIVDEKARSLPLKRPEGWVPKLPRWTLKFPDGVTELTVVYVGVQDKGSGGGLRGASWSAAAGIEGWLEGLKRPPVVVDRFEVVAGRDTSGSLVWTCYWTSKDDAEQSLAGLGIADIHESLGDDVKSRTGIWLEAFSPDLTRFETNYSGDDYQPGLAQLRGTEQIQHGLTGYWGAARDRMYASAYDTFEASDESQENNPIATPSQSKDNHIQGTNTKTIAHIRSGQFWENCPEEERTAYETKLEPHLRAGLTDIYSRPQDLGDYGLRFLRNLPPGQNHRDNNEKDKPRGDPRRETCAAGFFRSLSDLEGWAKDCPSHHKIYGGSVHHRNQFGSAGKMRTWHEICVLKAGEARWEYVNCLPDTGTLRFQGEGFTGEIDGV